MKAKEEETRNRASIKNIRQNITNKTIIIS